MRVYLKAQITDDALAVCRGGRELPRQVESLANNSRVRKELARA